ncbi:DUF6119 family protein [Pimelobacter simplex]|uniref:DUF6119 family protein n=1 Tax=Nocardioides simplex TaxID=2045 RepID=UPI003AAF9AC6
MNKEVVEFKAALALNKQVIEVAIAEEAGLDGVLYRALPKAAAPHWVSFLQPVLASSLNELVSTSHSALMLLRVRGRIFALTFGYGRSLLDLSKIEFGFGLKAALNVVDPAQLRSLDTKTFDDMVVTTSKESSKGAELPTFEVDVATDILRGVTGKCRPGSFAKRVFGTDSLVVQAEIGAVDLPGLCSKALDSYEDDGYRVDFGWIDHLSVVKDPVLSDALDLQMVGDLIAGETGATHLATPEPVRWDEIEAFTIAGTRELEYDDLDLDAYLGALQDRHAMTPDLLRGRKVTVRYARSGQAEQRWPLYRCLVSEQRLDGHLYALVEGRWFAIAESLVAEIDDYLATLDSPRTELPAAREGEAEGDYNQRLADSAAGLLKLDAKIKRPGGASSGIEFCDVLSVDRELIHVKRKSRSSTLSHLFAQGSIAGQTFLEDGVFRDGVRSAIVGVAGSAPHDPWSSIVPGGEDSVDRSQRYSVHFAVIAESAKAGYDWLPFFSKLNLKQHGMRLRRLGFDVAVTRVPIEDTGADASA